MDAREQERLVLAAVGDELVTSRRLTELVPDLSMRQVAAAMGRLKKQGRVRNTEMRCLACDGRGRARVWQATVHHPVSTEGQTRSMEGAS